MKSLLLLFCTLFCNAIHAQPGLIKGKVTADKDPLSFVTVSLDRTSYGTITAEDGTFEIKNIPTGTYQVVFSLLGYQTQHIRTVVAADGSVDLQVALQETIATLDEVVVTGVSRNTQLRKSPVPIAFISQKEMSMHVNNNIVDAVLKGVPGLSAVTTGPNISKPFIRGLGYNRVLTLYNGMRQEGQQWGDEHGIEIDQHSIERAEVVKGPASLIYGSDAVAGVINFIPTIPKGPEGKITGDAIAEYHTNNGMIGTSVGVAYRKNGWISTFRTSGKTAMSYQNQLEGRVYGTAFREFNLSGMVGLEKTWGSSYLYATVYENLQEIPDGSRDSLTRQFTRQVQESGLDDVKTRPIVATSELSTYQLNLLHQHIQHYRLFTRNRFKIGLGELNALVGVQQSVRREYNHPTLPQQAGLYVILSTLNYDVKYNFPTWKGIESTLGINGMYQTNRNSHGTDFPIPDYNLLDVGSFLFLKKSVGKLDFSGGLRYDTRFWNWQDFYVKKNPATGFDKPTFFPDTTGATLQFPAYRRQYNGLSGSLGMTYNLTERLLFKANVSRGYRAPNCTEVGSNGLDPGAHIVYLGNRNFNPEFSLQTDIGFLAYLKTVDISLELFNNSIENYIYQARLYDEQGKPVILVPGNFTYQYKQSQAQLYGAEVSFNLHPPRYKWLQFRNSLAFVQGLNRNQEMLEREGNAARYLPFIPPLHGRSEIRTTFDKPMGIFSHTYLRAEVDYYAAQNNFYAVDNTETATAGYALIHIGWGTTVSNRSQKRLFQVSFQVDNLLNTTYQSNLNRLKYFEYYTASPNGRSGIYNMGRNISFKLMHAF
ncbi:MAG: TonB-dependent receptor [Bacteroidota bacterium]